MAHSVKNLPAVQETWVLFLWSGRSPGEGNSNPLQYSCLENPVDGGAWRATVHEVTESRTWLSDWHSLSLSLVLRWQQGAKLRKAGR